MLKIKQHDLRPYLIADLQQQDESAIPDLNTATAITAVVRKKGTTTPVNRYTCEVIDAPNATVRYKWQTGDTDDPGVYEVEWEIDWDGEPQTTPTEGYYEFEIVDDIDNP